MHLLNDHSLSIICLIRNKYWYTTKSYYIVAFIWICKSVLFRGVEWSSIYNNLLLWQQLELWMALEYFIHCVQCTGVCTTQCLATSNRSYTALHSVTVKLAVLLQRLPDSAAGWWNDKNKMKNKQWKFENIQEHA